MNKVVARYTLAIDRKFKRDGERTGFRYANERMKRTKNYKKKEGRVFIKYS